MEGGHFGGTSQRGMTKSRFKREEMLYFYSVNVDAQEKPPIISIKLNHPAATNIKSTTINLSKNQSYDREIESKVKETS